MIAATATWPDSVGTPNANWMKQSGVLAEFPRTDEWGSSPEIVEISVATGPSASSVNLFGSFGNLVLRELTAHGWTEGDDSERTLRLHLEFFDSSDADLATFTLCTHGFTVVEDQVPNPDDGSLALEASQRWPMDVQQLDELGEWLHALLQSFQGRFNGFEI